MNAFLVSLLLFVCGMAAIFLWLLLRAARQAGRFEERQKAGVARDQSMQAVAAARDRLRHDRGFADSLRQRFTR